MRNYKLPNQTNIKLNFYFAEGNSIFCLSQNFLSESQDAEEVLEELKSFYKTFEKFVNKSLYSSIVTKEVYVLSYFDQTQVEKFYDDFHTHLNEDFEGYLEINCSDEILLNLNESQRMNYEIDKNKNQSFSDLVSTLPSFN